MEDIEKEKEITKDSTITVLEKTETNNKENEKKEEEKVVKNMETQDMPIETIQTAKEEKTTSDRKKNVKVTITLIVIAVLVIMLAIFSTIFAIVNMGDTKIMKGISIGKIDVSNMTEEQAKETLQKVCTDKSQKEIYLKYGELEEVITYKSIEAEYNIDKAIEEAHDIGRNGNIFKNNMEILKTWMYKKDIELEVTIDNNMIEQIAQNINNNIKEAVVQSSYYIEDGKLIITSGKSGLKVDEVQLIEKIYNVIRADNNETENIEIPMINANPEKIDIDKIHQEIYKEVQNAYYTQNPFTIHPESEGIDFDVENAKVVLQEEKSEYEIPLIITKPTKTVKEIGTEAFPDLLGTCSTKYVASNRNRTTNLQLAAQKVNGTVLLPGEEFSYNKVVGERTIQAGYKEAAVYSNGQVVDGLGGGICQISSTLYDAVIYANLGIKERRNHQFVTSYLPAGKDATVVYGSQDFKFVNTRKYPIRIEATVNGGIAKISIWGIKEEVEYDITIETRKIATIESTTQYIQDPTLPAGKEVVQQAGHSGSKVEAYKVVKLNGQVVSRTLLSKDTYNAMKRIVRIGTAGQ